MSNNHQSERYTTPPELIVLGTINRDHVVSVDRHPIPGETVLGHSYMIGTGGKGANQACAAAAAGRRPLLISAVGEGAAGAEMLGELASRGVAVEHVQRIPGSPSGVALITVSRAGENSIVVAAGAAGSLMPAQTTPVVAALAGPGAVVLAQLELPVDVVTEGCLAAHANGARIVLNLSPARAVHPDLLAVCDPLIVNEAEAGYLLRRNLTGLDDATRGAAALAAQCKSVVITLGGAGAVVADGGAPRHFPARKVTVVDTTGAGDAFAGALAAHLVSGGHLDDAVRAGGEAGALAVQHVGALAPKSEA